MNAVNTHSSISKPLIVWIWKNLTLLDDAILCIHKSLLCYETSLVTFGLRRPVWFVNIAYLVLAQLFSCKSWRLLSSFLWVAFWCYVGSYICGPRLPKCFETRSMSYSPRGHVCLRITLYITYHSRFTTIQRTWISTPTSCITALGTRLSDFLHWKIWNYIEMFWNYKISPIFTDYFGELNMSHSFLTNSGTVASPLK